MKRWADNLLPLMVLAMWGPGGCGPSALNRGFGDGTQRVAAEYRGLENKKVAVLVQTAQNTRHPLLAYEISSSVSQRLQDRVPGISVIHPQRVNAFQTRNPRWTRRPYTESAKALGADRLVIVLLRDYQLLNPGKIKWQGFVHADVDVFETQAKASDAPNRFVIETRYPHAPVALANVHNEKSLRLATCQEFSIALANKFHDHESWRPKP